MRSHNNTIKVVRYNENRQNHSDTISTISQLWLDIFYLNFAKKLVRIYFSSKSPKNSKQYHQEPGVRLKYEKI